MRFSRRNKYDRMLPLELTPMIDVVFLLIVFFMVTAQFARYTRAELELPLEPGEQQPAEEAGLVINIMRDGTLIVNEQTLVLSELMLLVEHEVARLGAPSEMKLLLRVDRDAPATNLNQVVTQLQQQGIYTARIATEIPSRP